MNIEEESKLIVSQIEGIHSNAEICSIVLSRNISRIYEEMNVDSNDPVSFIIPRNKISSEINYALVTYEDVESAIFIDINSNVISNLQILPYNKGDVLESDLVQKLDQIFLHC